MLLRELLMSLLLSSLKHNGSTKASEKVTRSWRKFLFTHFPWNSFSWDLFNYVERVAFTFSSSVPSSQWETQTQTTLKAATTEWMMKKLKFSKCWEDWWLYEYIHGLIDGSRWQRRHQQSWRHRCDMLLMLGMRWWHNFTNLSQLASLMYNERIMTTWWLQRCQRMPKIIMSTALILMSGFLGDFRLIRRWNWNL